ncbi:uncharacterized protein BdWA1_003940, partial [Babesia duncani]
ISISPPLGSYEAVREVNFSIQELNNDIEIQFDNRVLSLPANSSCSIQVSLEAKIGLVGVKKPVADVDEENGNGLESGFEDVISSVLKELIEPTLNGSQEGKSKMNSKRLNIINAIKEVCKSCCCYKNRECLEASDISLAVTQFCKDCCSKDPKCCNTDDVLKQLKDFCVCPVKEIMEKNFENTQCKDVCKCHEKSTCCSKAVIEAFLYDLCPFKEARSVLHICPEHKSNEETCCGNGKNCKCTQKVKDKLALCGCKFCKIKKDLNEGFFNSEENKCQDCSGHECYLKDKFLQWLKKHCDCKVNREDITQAIQALSEKCKGKTCCNSEEIKTAVQSVITEKCQCTKMNCCFKNISNGDDLAVEKEDKANEKDILKNIAKEIFNYYKPPEPKTTGFIVLNSCKSKTLTLCSNNDGNGEKSNEHICVSSDNLKIYNEAFKDLKAFTKISSAYVSEFHPNSKIMIAFQSVTLKFCDFCSNGNEGFKIDGFPVNQSGCFLNAIGPSFFADAFSGGSVQSVRVQVGTQNVPGPGDKSGKSSYRHVEFCIEQLKEDLLVKFENRVLSLDSNVSSCSIKVSLHAKINLVGVKWAQPDVSKENGDPEKGDSDSEITVINSAYNTMLDELISPDANSDSSKKSILDAKRQNIIDAIKDVCKDCCCNRNEFCIQPKDVSEAVKEVCAQCCCKSTEPCVDSNEIINKVKELCVDCCCKKDDCCNTKDVLSQIGDFCVCLIKDAKEKLENCTCSGCSSCQENCIDKQKLMKEIEQLCSCSEAKKVVEEASKNCDSCKASGSCECCQEIQKKFKDCSCMACDLKTAIEQIKQDDGSKCCNNPSCPYSSDPDCRKRTDVLKALNAYCKCKDQVKEIKKKIEKLCQSCKSKKCCDTGKIESQIEQLCNSCPCKTHPKCCDESDIDKKVKGVIESKCTCKKNKCCFNKVTSGDISDKSKKDEQKKLKEIALAIFKYFRPPIAHETGVMTLKSTKDIELEFLSSSSNEKITVDTKNKNILKIPKQAFKDLMASSQIPQVKVTTFHKNTMLSIHFEEISLTFQKLNGTGFEIDGYPINGTFLMQLGYQPIGPYTKNSANMRKKTENEPKKHNLSWSIDNHYPQIDKNKCSCSILSNPLFGTVFGAICLTISIVQFIIALFVSQGYYDGFQSYMDAVSIEYVLVVRIRSPKWISIVVRYGYLSTPTLGTYAAVSGCFLNAIGPSFFADAFTGGSVQSVRVLVGSSGSPRNVEFWIEQIGDLSVKFEDRLLTLDSGSDCKLKVSLHAKINLVGSRFSEPDTTKDNGDPDKNGSDSDITQIDESYQKMLDELVNFSSNDQSKVNTMNAKRKKIIEAIKAVCQKDCSCGSNCCFRDVDTGDLSKKTAEKTKLKNIAKAIFKYFRPPIAYETGLMTLESTTETELEFSSSGGDANITVDKGNVLKIPVKAFQSLMASTKINQDKVKDFHPNSMMSIKFEEICLTFQEFTGTGFCIDGYSINGSFSMQLGYLPAGIFTRNSANWRKKTGSKPNEKHDLSWSIGQPLIDPSKCSCSILSDPLFGTVFGAICISISIVQFIIALFVSQGYYDGFQSYMDAVSFEYILVVRIRSQKWISIVVRTVQDRHSCSRLLMQYFVNVEGISISPTLGTYEAVRVLVASSGNHRNVDFCIEQLKQDLSVMFDNRVLSLDSGSSPKIRVSLLAKINLVGVKWAQPDVSKENGDPDKNDSDSDITQINSAHNTMLDELISPDANSDANKKSILDGKRKNIIEAIKDVCKDCCCRKEGYCIKPDDISQAVKDVCKDCCCKSKDPCVDSSKIMEHVNKLCQNCCCKKEDCCGTKGVLSQIGDFCVCLIKDAKEKLDDCKCSGCKDCQGNCIDKTKLKKEILKLCSCSEAKKVVEEAPQKCDSCKGSGGSGSCQCCEAVQEKFKDCPCMACDLQQVIDDLQGTGENGSNCCNSSSCSCSSDSNSNCRKRTDVLDALNAYCKCTTQRKEIKEKIEKLCKECKDKKCCDVSKIESQIEKLCNSCPCKTHPTCCNESEINKKVKGVIESKCTCKKFKCCFNGIKDANQSLNTDEQGKLKKIALAIFKYFRPPIAHSTGVMTLKSTTETELEFSSGSSSGDDKITVDSSKNVLKIPKQAFKSLMASSQIPQVKVTTFHKNTMLSIHFEEISLTFQKLNGTGFEIDGYPINGTFLMQLGYQPIGPFTKNSANMRKKTENEPKKHNLSWSIDNHYPQIDKNKCSCSILSNPLFGTVFGAICLTISIVQFIIALFVSQGYYDGFQSYMDAVRSGFSWPTQYDNVASSIFWVRVASSGSQRQVEFCIQELKEGLTVTFKDRVLTLDSKSVCKLKVSLAAKINLVGVKWAQPDVSKENGDPDKNDSDSDITQINSAHNTMLDELISPDANSDANKKSILDGKRKNIIEAIKDVCKDCCCRKEGYCIQPKDISQAVKDVCKDCCCKSKDPCVDSSKIMEHVNKLCQNCCCKKEDCCGTKGVLSQIGEFCVCLIKDAKEKLDDCKCSGCSACQDRCIDKQKLKKEILKLCSCSEAKKVVEEAPQKCDSCKGSGGSGCECCEAAKKQFESCPCMACDLKKIIENLQGSGENGSNCCNSSSCPCSSGSNCRKKTDVLSALNAYCKCTTQRDKIKEKVKDLCKHCNKNKCCDVSEIQSAIQKICNSCPCKTHPTCCNEDEIKSKVKNVIESKCTCKKFKCCFNGIKDANQSLNTDEQGKLKKIALTIFKYFRPPIAHSTGVMTLKSTTETDLEFSSSGGDTHITVDSKNNNALKIPKQAFKSLMASSQIPQVKVTTFHKNTMLSIYFEDIRLTFQELNGTGFEIDGYPINGTFLMQLGYQPIGPYTKNTANWRKKNSDGKHNLSWDISSNHPQIDKNKCSCSILSDPLFGTVFGAICLTISIVQFIIALFVSQGYYDGFQSYMDAVRVLVGSSGSPRNVEFWIEQIGDLSVKFEDRLLTLDSGSDCKLKVSLHAKINLVGSRFSEPDTTKDNGDPDKNGSDSDITQIDESYQKMLDELVNFSSNDQSKVNTMNAKRKKIIEAIKAVCQKDCSCGSNCCFRDVDTGDLSKKTAEKTKLKNIAKAIFKYFRPPIAYETGLMTLESTTETELEFSSSGGDANITVDKGNVLKIPVKAFQSLMASTKINQDKAFVLMAIRLMEVSQCSWDICPPEYSPVIAPIGGRKQDRSLMKNMT